MSELSPAKQEERLSMLDLLDRVANKGVVISGDVVISVADVDLLYLGLRLLLTSVQTAMDEGILPARPEGASR
ncbi:MAG TPA: gas vesicle protein [Vulgatibacter sp.]|nr:gas vesicle protein [Vulgatibacter sp.]